MNTVSNADAIKSLKEQLSTKQDWAAKAIKAGLDVPAEIQSVIDDLQRQINVLQLDEKLPEAQAALQTALKPFVGKPANNLTFDITFEKDWIAEQLQNVEIRAAALKAAAKLTDVIPSAKLTVLLQNDEAGQGLFVTKSTATGKTKTAKTSTSDDGEGGTGGRGKPITIDGVEYPSSSAACKAYGLQIGGNSPVRVVKQFFKQDSESAYSSIAGKSPKLV